MPQGHKIATCCYCGTRAALVLTGKTRHELACSACGAPLHNMKMLPLERVAETGRQRRVKAVSHLAPPRMAKPARVAKPKRKKRRKGLMSKLFEEAFDVIEDIFD